MLQFDSFALEFVYILLFTINNPLSTYQYLFILVLYCHDRILAITPFCHRFILTAHDLVKPTIACFVAQYIGAQ